MNSSPQKGLLVLIEGCSVWWGRLGSITAENTAAVKSKAVDLLLEEGLFWLSLRYVPFDFPVSVGLRASVLNSPSVWNRPCMS